MQTVNAHHAAIPTLGFGVFRMSDAEVERVIPAALAAGFRHFDTAQIYQNEAALGRALQAAGVRHEDLFLTTKVWVDNYSPDKFAASVVKIQQVRGHKVIDTGPYQYVRHPMYTSLIFRTIGTPLALGSWWGLYPASALIILVVVRILFEERALSTGLEGYKGYIQRVPYRLIPLVW